MTTAPVERDERTTAVENAGYRWSYLFLSFGMLALIAYRSFAHGQSSWDLFALVLLGGAVNAAYQGMHRVLYRRWAVLSVIVLIVAALIGVAMVLLRR
jgi:tryptophan-rich sensory protein